MYASHDLNKGCHRSSPVDTVKISVDEGKGAELPLLPPPISFANLKLPPPEAFANTNLIKEESKRNAKPPIPAKPQFIANRNMNNNTLIQSPMGTLNGTTKLKNLMLLREPTRKPSLRQVFSDDDSYDSLSDSDDSVDENENEDQESTKQEEDSVSTSGTSTVSSVSTSSFDQITEENKGQYVIAKISIPEQKLTKCMQLKITETVWTAKQRIIQSLVKKLNDPLNYGLYHEKMGIFLLDHVPMVEYIEAGSVGALQMLYKCRKMEDHPRNSKEGRHHTKMQSTSKRRDFLLHVQQYSTEKIYSGIRKGIDPNFQCPNTGETPLTILSNGQSRSECVSVFMALLGGGAHLDYRNQRGFTPMHVAARSGNIQMIKTLLEFNASPNVVDGRDLTPLYHCILLGSDTEVARVLLEHGASVGCRDSQGWTEIHQACRHGRLQLLELLLDSDKVDWDMINARNASGNTPLHVCALYNQETCAATMLINGADTTIANFSNQDAVQVAHVASNVSVAKLISEFPSRKDSAKDTLMRARAETSEKKPSANQNSEGSPKKHSKKAGRSTWTPSSLVKHSKQYILQKQHSSGTLGRGKESYTTPIPLENRFDSKLPPNAKMPDVKYPNVGNGSVDENKVRIVTRNYDAKNEDELTLRVGTRVIVLNARSSPAGYHDGMVGGQRGFFPIDCVEEVQLRRPLPDTGQRTTSENFNDRNASLGKGKNSIKKQHTSADAALTQQRNTMPDSISLVSFESSEDMQNGSTGRSSSVRSEDLAHYQATSTPGVYHNTRGVALWRGNDGFGFILRGAKSEGPVHEFNPSAKYPGLQYLESVEDGSNAHNAGLRSGDFIIRIGEADVRKYGHQQLVDTIRACGEPLHLLVTTVIHTSPNGDTASSHSSPATRKLIKGHAKTDSVSSALDQLDNVLAMEDIEAERTASVRRVPGRKVGCEQLQSLFRQNPTVEAVATLPRQPQQSTFSSAKKPIRVLPPQLNSSNTFQYEHVDTRQHDDETRSLRSMSSSSSNSSTFTTWGRSSGPPPPMKDFRAHSVSGATGERLLAQTGAKTRKMPPPPPKRINSRLSVSIPEEEPVRSPPTYTSPTMTVRATQQTTLHPSPAPITNTQSDMAAAIALAARNRAERASRSEEHKKQEPEPNPPSPPQGPVIEETPTKSVAEISSALSIALAAKQRSLSLKASGKTGVIEPKRPASFKITPTVKSTNSVQRMSEERQVLPPPPSNLPPPPSYDDVRGLELPPPPSFPAPDPHHTQYNHMTFDELMLPPPPMDLLPSPTSDSSNTKDIKAKPTTLGFLPPPPIPPPDEDDGCTSPNGADNLSNADSGVADVAGDGLNLSHGHRLSHDHVSGDNHSTVSSLSTTSTMSSEDQNSDYSTPFGERAWPLREVRHVEENVSKSSPPANSQTGNMYLDVLKKAKSKQQPPVPNSQNTDSKKNNLRPGITVTKMTFAPITSIPPPQSEESDKPKAANVFPPAPKEYANVETKPLFPKSGIQTQKVSFAPKAPVQKTTEKPPVKTTPIVAPTPAKIPQNEPTTKTPPNSDGDVTKKPLAQWSVGDVSDWLKELGLQMYISSFEENEISGEHLPDLGKDELIELGVKPFGHRLTIDRSIKKLKGA